MTKKEKSRRRNKMSKEPEVQKQRNFTRQIAY